MLYAKMIWDHDPLYVKTVDKYAVREFVAERLGGDCLIPLIGVYDTPEDIDFDALSPPFVIKATHGYNMTLLAREGETIDREAIIKQTSQWLDDNIYNRWKEWAYRDCQPRLVVEAFLGDGKTPPADLKFYIFNGRTGFIVVEHDRFGEQRSNYFDRDWRALNLYIRNPPRVPAPARPANLEALLTAAERLAEGFDFVRVDLYEDKGHIYFGEITHYPGGGGIKFQPYEFDGAVGELWRKGTPLPERFYQ